MLRNSELTPEWYLLYQILTTYGVGSNEDERVFSTLRRVKTWIRNRMRDVTLEPCIKASSSQLPLTPEATDFVIKDFISHPGQAKERNISLFL
ncbi:unnamed protein product [Didymodactylos carnosus]|uniref:HAT C-terminal dimerisation domain-containing protein n=1 Tax=Didymodactylos carnosus TaxID=1234261 RepID=A0A814RSC0_9BILA|nr:unnamed protein product [Didymodactylos carnosus]CAF3900350.1 unnamed protein product [Didymodactylos carnosus]